MKLVKAILIDPFACTITEVEHDASGIEGIYKFLSHESMPVSCFTTARGLALADRDAVFVDDEGSLKQCDRFFAIRGMQPIAGKGLVLGADDRGDSVSASTNIVALRRQTFFLERTHKPWFSSS